MGRAVCMLATRPPPCLPPQCVSCVLCVGGLGCHCGLLGEPVALGGQLVDGALMVMVTLIAAGEGRAVVYIPTRAATPRVD